jgi:hypothetical protein
VSLFSWTECYTKSSLLHDSVEHRKRSIAALQAPDVPAAAATHTKDTSSPFSFDFGSLVGRDSAKSPRYPEKFIKILDVSLQKIAMGKDPKYVEVMYSGLV